MSSHPIARIRPKERVREYLTELLKDKTEPQRLPTMRDLASHLGVSLATVHGVYQELKRQGRISTRAGDGSYLLAESDFRRVGEKRRFRIFFNRNVSARLNEHLLISAYYSALLQQAMMQKLTFDFAMLSADEGQSEEEQVVQLFRAGELDGMIILPFVPSSALIQACEREGIPYVTLHREGPHSVSNFVTPDFFEAGVRFAKALVAGGRQRLVFVAYNTILESTTAWLFCSGLSCGYLQKARRLEMKFAPFKGPRRLQEGFGAWLDAQPELPDAVVCHRMDYVPVVQQILKERGIRVPEEVSVVVVLSIEGENDSLAPTRVQLPVSGVAAAALQRLQTALEEKRPSLPPVQIPCSIVTGGTTLPVENMQLESGLD